MGGGGTPPHMRGGGWIGQGGTGWGGSKREEGWDVGETLFRSGWGRVGG